MGLQAAWPVYRWEGPQDPPGTLLNALEKVPSCGLGQNPGIAALPLPTAGVGPGSAQCLSPHQAVLFGPTHFWGCTWGAVQNFKGSDITEFPLSWQNVQSYSVVKPQTATRKMK